MGDATRKETLSTTGAWLPKEFSARERGAATTNQSAATIPGTRKAFTRPLVLRFINTVSHRERRCAAPARRATEAYSQQYGARSATKRERMQRRSNATEFVKRCTKATGPP